MCNETDIEFWADSESSDDDVHMVRGFWYSNFNVNFLTLIIFVQFFFSVASRHDV